MIVLTNWTLQVFRFYEDGTESGSVPAAAQNTNVTRTEGTDSANILLRVAIWDGLGSGGSATDDWQLQYSKNAGAYANVTTSSSNVKGFNSSNLSDGNATTQRLTGATGTYGAGEISEDGLVDDLLVGASTNTELLYSLTVVFADCSNNDTLDFRVLHNGGTITYNFTPRITVAKSTGFIVTPVGSLIISGVSTQRTSGNYTPSGTKNIKGLSVAKTSGTFNALGSLSFAGVASASNLVAYSHQASGGVAKVTSPSNPVVGLSYTTSGGGVSKVVSPSNPVTELNYVTTGGSVGGVTSPSGGSPAQGFSYFASGAIGGMVADEGGDGEQGEGGEEGGGNEGDGLRYEYETFVRCCDIPPKIECCDCENGLSTIWEVQESLEGMYSHEFAPGIKQAWGCEKFSHDGVRRIEHYAGPTYPGEPERTGECHWASVEPQPGRCCQFGCEDGPPESGFQYVSAYMSCYIYEEVPPTDPVYQWYLDCACDDLWVSDSEWSSYEDCRDFDSNPEGCHCSNDNGAYAGSEAECNALKAYYEGLGFACGACSYEEVIPGSDGYPRFVSHVAGLSGPCGCSRAFVHLNPLDPLCKDMLDSVDTSNLDDYDCEGCNTYVLIQYHGLDINGDPCPGYPCGLGCVHLCNGSDVGCSDCCEGWGYYYCLGYPATLTLCPAESINPPASDSDCNPDVLCCEDQDGLGMAPAMSMAPASAIPDDAVHFQILGTSTNGYLKREGDTYTGGVPPIVLEVDKVKKTLNGKPLTMLSEDLFWGRGRIGGTQVGFWIEVME